MKRLIPLALSLSLLLVLGACSDDSSPKPDGPVKDDAAIDAPKANDVGIDVAPDVGPDIGPDIGPDTAPDAPVAQGCTPSPNSLALAANGSGSTLLCIRVKLQSLAGNGLCPMSLQACPGDTNNQISIFQKTASTSSVIFRIHATFTDSVVSSSHGNVASNMQSVSGLPVDKTSVTITTTKFVYTFNFDGDTLTMTDGKKR
ncbi:MAG: hypothetical protein KC503_19705 [Myxococcales bacterium]|nr:hypothetical protein [Myxococcales bacterium]